MPRAALPATLGFLGFAEYHAPSDDILPATVHPLAGPEYPAGRALELSARVVDRTSPDSVHLLMRPAPGATLERALLSFKLSFSKRVVARWEAARDRHLLIDFSDSPPLEN